MVNDHDTLDLVTDTPVDGVIGGVVGHYFNEKTGDAINNGALN